MKAPRKPIWSVLFAKSLLKRGTNKKPSSSKTMAMSPGLPQFLPTTPLKAFLGSISSIKANRSSNTR
ncbi:hypothetical protein HZ326_0111 [Fusarium oxysporum f. sp. albedinis]|nr:hypothetical protein HZ326_0111 [Fusarium oxysporum f. sp. albedinis]